MQQNVVFISHSSVDKPFVDKLVSDLKKNGVNVWYDKFDIKLGDSIPGRINEGLSKAKYFIVVLSNSSINSKWVLEELNSALVKQINLNGTFILPVKIDDCSIPPLLSHRKYLNLKDDYDKNVAELLGVLKEDLDIIKVVKDKELFPWPDTEISDEHYIYLYSTRFDKFFKMYYAPDWTASKTIYYITTTLNLPWNKEVPELGMRWSFSYGLVVNDKGIGLNKTLKDAEINNGDVVKINISGTYEDLFEKQLKSLWDGSKIYHMTEELLRRGDNLKNAIANRGVLNRSRLKEIADSFFSQV
jgi:hypothetical protein